MGRSEDRTLVVIIVILGLSLLVPIVFGVGQHLAETLKVPLSKLETKIIKVSLLAVGVGALIRLTRRIRSKK